MRCSGSPTSVRTASTACLSGDCRGERARAGAGIALSRQVDVAGGRISCLGSGSGGPAAVFIGGAGGLAIAWEPARAEVAAFTRAVAYDRPGYGAAHRPRAR